MGASMSEIKSGRCWILIRTPGVEYGQHRRGLIPFEANWPLLNRGLAPFEIRYLFTRGASSLLSKGSLKAPEISTPDRHQTATVAPIVPRELAMPASEILRSSEAPPIPPSCPTCGKKMRQTGVTPTCQGTVYDYLCSEDGDCLSWRPHHSKMSAVA